MIPNDSVISSCVDALRAGQTILYPTDTIWGLGCDARDTRALERIYEIKNRHKNKPLITLVSSLTMMKEQVADLHPRIETLLYYHNKPLTLICKAQSHVHPLMQSSSNGTMAIRIVQNEFCQKLIDALGAPISSTSANISTEPFPLSWNDISDTIKSEVDYSVPFYIDQSPHDSAPSVIATFDDRGKISFLR